MDNTFTVTIGKQTASKSGYWLISDCPEVNNLVLEFGTYLDDYLDGLGLDNVKIIDETSCTFELGA